MAGRVGDRLLDVALWVALCHGCHHEVTVNPAQAIRDGWSLSRLGDVQMGRCGWGCGCVNGECDASDAAVRVVRDRNRWVGQ